MSSQSSALVGVVVAILIVGAVATLGYYQLEVAPSQTTSSSTTSTQNNVNCATTPSQCVNVNIIPGASSQPAGYQPGSTTLYGYDPLTITVVIGVNNTVVWTNKDVTFHTATSTSGPDSFDSGCLDGTGASCPTGGGSSTFQFTFTKVGTYNYHCNYHPYMQGTIIVEAGTGTSSTSTTTGTSTTSSIAAAG